MICEMPNALMCDYLETSSKSIKKDVFLFADLNPFFLLHHICLIGKLCREKLLCITHVDEFHYTKKILAFNYASAVLVLLY